MTSTAWNVRDDEGVIVDDLDRLATVLQTTTKGAAAVMVADNALLEAAPPALQAEVKAAARPKPGDGTPPPIATGNFVSWSGGKGKVDLLVSNGKVPGVSEDVEGTAKSPAARVTVWENEKATSKKIGMSTHKLKRIAPITGQREKKAATPAALVQMLTQYDAVCDELHRPMTSRVTGFAVKSVYDRGLDAYPGTGRTALSREQWATGRVEHFFKAAALDVPPSEAGHDVDLLTPGHPLHKPLEREDAPPGFEREDPPEGVVRLEQSAVEAQVKALTEGIDLSPDAT